VATVAPAFSATFSGPAPTWGAGDGLQAPNAIDRASSVVFNVAPEFAWDTGVRVTAGARRGRLMTDNRQIADQVLSRARSGGAQGAEVSLTRESVLRLQSGGRRPTVLDGGPRSGVHLSIRVYGEGGALGSAAGAVANQASCEALVDRALAAMAKADPNPLQGPTARYDVMLRGLSVDDPRHSAIDDEMRREVLSTNEDALRHQPGISAGPFIYAERRAERLYASSRNILLSEVGTRYDLTGSVRMTADAGVSYLGALSSRHFADVASVPLGVDLARRTLAHNRKVAPPPAGAMVVFDSRAMAALLRSIVLAFDAERVAGDTSFVARAMDRPLASAKVHLVDDAGMTGALRTRAFDERGVPPMALPLIREGEVGSFYLGPEGGRKRDLRPTGHARADGQVWPGNLILRPGSRTRNMIFPELRRFLLIDDLPETGGANLATGALDLQVRPLVFEGTECLGSAGPMRLRTNVVDLLTGVVDLASDHERIGDVDACTVIVEGLTLTG
jgi:PmbA protein